MPIVARTTAQWGYVAALLLLTCVFFILGLKLVPHADDGAAITPIHWKPYCDALRDLHLMDGRKVFVFVFAELAPESELAFADIDSAKIAQLCDERNCETLLLRYDDWDDPNIRSVWKDVGHTKNPLLVLYSPNEAPRSWRALSELRYADSEY